MIDFSSSDVITRVDDLQALYGEPSARSLTKEIDHVSPVYQRFIDASPFALIASVGPEGVDISPRGDAPGFVRVVSPKQLMLPDRRGNNRADTLTNIIRDPKVSVLFMIPGVGETLRVIGKARVVVNAALNESFTVQNKPARSVIVLDVDAVYFQCQKALARSRLWQADAQVERGQVPTAGEMLKSIEPSFDAASYDAGYPEHMKNTIY